MPNTVATGVLATEGNELSTSFHAGKASAVRCWREAVDASGLDDKVLAADAGMSAGYYSKVASGEQGDLLGLVYRLGAQHPELRRDFICRLAEFEMADPFLRAVQDLHKATMRVMVLSGERVPMRMARATVPDRPERKTA